MRGEAGASSIRFLAAQQHLVAAAGEIEQGVVLGQAAALFQVVRQSDASLVLGQDQVPSLAAQRLSHEQAVSGEHAGSQRQSPLKTKAAPQ